MQPNPSDYPSWLKVSIIEGAFQRMEAPRQVYLATRVNFRLMNPKYKKYLDEAFKFAYSLFYFDSLNREDYEKLIDTLINMMKEKGE